MFSCLMSYILSRLAQPSSWLGIGSLVLTVVTHGAFDATTVTALLTSLGLIHINEKPVVNVSERDSTLRELAAILNKIAIQMDTRTPTTTSEAVPSIFGGTS